MMQSSNSIARMEARGGEGTFEVLVQPLLDGAFGLACSMLGDREAAEDAVQEAAIRAWRGIGHLRRDASPRPWFFAIVANQCRDVLRGRRRSGGTVVDLPEPVEGDHADRVARDLDLARALAHLSPDQSALLYLRFHVGMPPSDIAGVLHWRIGTVKSRLHRALRKLESELGPDPSEESR